MSTKKCYEWGMEGVATQVYEELDIVRITTNAYHKEGLHEAEEGTIVLVHKGDEQNAYEVEFENWTKRFPIKVKTLAGNEIAMVKKWRE